MVTVAAVCFWHGLETLLPDYKDKDPGCVHYRNVCKRFAKFPISSTRLFRLQTVSILNAALIAVLCLGGLYLLYNFQFIMRIIFVVRKCIEHDMAFHTHQCLLLHKGNINHLFIYIHIYHRTIKEVRDHFQYLDNDLLSLEKRRI